MSGNRSILLAFSLILCLRLLTEMPRALSLIGWAEFAQLDFNRIISGLLLGFCLLAVLAQNRIRMSKSILHVSVLMILFLGVSTFNAINTFSTIGMPLSGVVVVLLRFMIEIVIVIFIYNYVHRREDLGALIGYFFKPALFIFCLTSFLQIATGSYGDVQGVARIVGPFGSPTTLAGFLHLFIAITLYLYHGEHSRVFWIMIITEYILLLFTGSVATIAANILFLLLIAKKQRWIKSINFYRFFPIICILALAGVIALWEKILGRLAILFNLDTFELSRGSSLQWRFDAWTAYLSLLEDKPMKWIFGLGVGTQRYILHPDYPGSLWRLFDAPGTHNDYLAVLIDFGIFGLILFAAGLIAFWNFLIRAEQVNTKLYYLRFYFATVLVVMLTENYIDQLIAFVFLAFTVGIYNSAKNRSENPSITTIKPQPNG